MKPELIENTPIGTRRIGVFASFADDTSGMVEQDDPVYSDADRARGKLIRDARKSDGLSLWRGAEQLGITAAELSGLEQGRLWFKSEKVAAAMLAILGSK